MRVSVAKLCNPERYRLHQAVEEAKRSAQAGRGFEMKIVRYLQVSCLSNPVPMATVFRGLEILGGMAGSGAMEEARMIALLRPFLRSSEPRIASKCVMVLGRHSKSMHWLNAMMAEDDDRIRANLIEALWKRREPEVREVMLNALDDPHPRVIANAAFGLYLLGAGEWIEGLARLLGHAKPAFRRSGIWVLKTSGVPDAPERVRHFIKDPDPTVRRAAFDALITLRDRRVKKSPAAA